MDPSDEVFIPNTGFVCHEPSMYIAGEITAPILLLEKDDLSWTLNL